METPRVALRSLSRDNLPAMAERASELGAPRQDGPWTHEPAASESPSSAAQRDPTRPRHALGDAPPDVPVDGGPCMKEGGGNDRRRGLGVATQGRDAQRQDRPQRIRADARRDRRGDPMPEGSSIASLDPREPLPATPPPSEVKRWSRRSTAASYLKDRKRRRISRLHQPRAQTAQHSDRSPGRAAVDAADRLAK